MEIGEKTDFFDYITEKCLAFFAADVSSSPMQMVQEIMNHQGFPMHCPEHHYLIPAVLLTVSRKVQGESIEILKKDLAEAQKRAKNVLGGFCGYYGTCGAAVGNGIYASILTDTNPHSIETWPLVNRIVADTLHDIAQINGPRCCKRNTFFAIRCAGNFVKEYFGFAIGGQEEIACTYSQKNEDCKYDECPFFSGK